MYANASALAGTTAVVNVRFGSYLHLTCEGRYPLSWSSHERVSEDWEVFKSLTNNNEEQTSLLLYKNAKTSDPYIRCSTGNACFDYSVTVFSKSMHAVCEKEYH